MTETCGSCRFYAARQCHVAPPTPVITVDGYDDWQRPPVSATTIACQQFTVSDELKRSTSERRPGNPSEAIKW